MNNPLPHGEKTGAANLSAVSTLRVGMVGLGMIFDETYRPFFEAVHQRPLYDPAFGIARVELAAVASRTGQRAEDYRRRLAGRVADFASFVEPGSIEQLLAPSASAPVDLVCIATPDNRHFAAARAALTAGKHVLVEKPSVLSLAELDELVALARRQKVLAKVVYHKLLDPDHKKLRTLVVDGELKHVNNGYCSLLEPISIATGQFAQWIEGRNPGTYVAVHYIKLIDFTFGGRLKSIHCTGQRGLVGPAEGPTWDSTQLRLVYAFADRREAAFDIHTSWVTPDNFPGYVEQEVQFRFDNGVWNGHGRRRGVECTIAGRTPLELKTTINNHYNAKFLEPWNERTQRGYGVEVLERFAREVAMVEFGGPADQRDARLATAAATAYNDLSADRQTVAAVQAMEAILAKHADGTPNTFVEVNGADGGLVLRSPGTSVAEVLYAPRV
ncbi:MAG TPA: Gfo/Idh/MocA family oxidoreductase [Pirellulales bacterium]|jgi:predicted dehydrogenase|nr:Gfo/Idh/MocA family oxidoreductase [Pirellulales bacterium]